MPREPPAAPVVNNAAAKSRSPCLVAYDIRNNKRLRKVHRRSAAEGHALQYSLFALDLTETEQVRLLADLHALTQPDDDVRLFPFNPSTSGFRLGPQLCETDGVFSFGSAALNIINRLKP
jgi:CRISPR-associated endonuclease Cas2